MDHLLISVLMSTYKEPLDYVQQAVDSILTQTYNNIEFVIVIDNPKNKSLINYLKSVSDKDTRTKIIINDHNIGLAMSLNKALSMANGDIIARMDADDISKSDRLKKELEYLVKHNLDVVGCAVDKIDEEGKIWGKIESYSENPDDYAKLLPIQNVFVHPSTMMRTKIIKNSGGYRDFPSCQDYDLWLRLLSKGCKFGVCPEKLLQFRRHKKSITATCRYGQYLNESYIRKLYYERKNNYGRDSFSPGDLREYLSKKGFYDRNKSSRQNNLLICYSYGVNEFKKKHIVRGVAYVLKSLKSKAVRDSIKISLKSRKMRKQCIGK